MYKPDTWHSYPKIYAIGHADIKELFEDEVIVEEKVDGSQFSFGVYEDGLRARSKGQQLVIDAPESLFVQSVETVKKLEPNLRPYCRYICEYLKKPKHNTLAYDRIPKDHIVLLDVAIGNEEYMSYEDKKKEAERLGIECVPLLYKGKVESVEQLLKFLEDTSFLSLLGGQKIEGVVCKNYKKFSRSGKAMFGKYVSEAFKEVHGKEWKTNNPGRSDVVLQLIDKFKTEARWNKAIQHLKESGDCTESVKDIGNLIREIQKDTKVECEDEIKQLLFDWAWPKISRGIVRGAPEWYKKKLAENAFTVEGK